MILLSLDTKAGVMALFLPRHYVKPNHVTELSEEPDNIHSVMKSATAKPVARMQRNSVLFGHISCALLGLSLSSEILIAQTLLIGFIIMFAQSRIAELAGAIPW